MVSTITCNTPDVNGQVVCIACATTATGDPTVTLTLPTYAPNIDLSVENPVLQIFHMGTTADDFANSTLSDLAEQVARNADGVSDPDTAGEFKIMTARTIKLEKTADAAGICFVTYIAHGSQQT